MPRHAAITTRQTRRSPSAAKAHSAGLVTHTIHLSAPSAMTARERAMTAATRNSVALAFVATAVWAYDLARLVSGA